MSLIMTKYQIPKQNMAQYLVEKPLLASTAVRLLSMLVTRFPPISGKILTTPLYKNSIFKVSCLPLSNSLHRFSQLLGHCSDLNFLLQPLLYCHGMFWVIVKLEDPQQSFSILAESNILQYMTQSICPSMQLKLSCSLSRKLGRKHNILWVFDLAHCAG